MFFLVTKHNTAKENFSREKIEKTFNIAATGFEDTCHFEEVKKELEKYLMENVETKNITKLLIKAIINLISIENTHRQTIAGRILIMDMYKQASRNRNITIENIYSWKNFSTHFQEYIQTKKYYQNFMEYYTAEEIQEAGKYIKKEYDFEYGYTTALMLKKRYLLNPNNIIHELPQEMYMTIALFLAIPETQEKRLATALAIYDACASQKISLPTPTLMNARTNFHQLSSCFKLNVDDDLRGIYHNIENMAQISKFGGWIGVYLGNIRSKGSDIRGVRWASWGVLPRTKVINDTAIAVNQLGARAGAISVTLDIRHRDILDFLDMQTETGDIRRKSFDIFPAVSVPDIFMQRVIDNQNRTLFDPKEINDITWKKLQNLFWDEFKSFYEQLEADPNITLKQSIPAKELFKTFLKSVVETGMPYTFFRDTVNKTNPNKHAGNIYSTQLCTEIAQNTSPASFIEETEENGEIHIKYKPGESVVCNLASINVAKVNTLEEINRVIPIAMRILDNVITLNFFPIKEAEITAKRYRSVGLGFLGLSEYLAVNNMVYDSAFARTHIDQLFEQYAYATIKSSHQLAQERWAYELFQGSERSKGTLFWRDESRYANHSTLKEKRTDLIQNIKKDGLRFAYHLSPAPNTSTSLVVGTTAGLLPIYKKYFVETNGVAPSVNVAPNLTPENMRFYKEYVNMKMPEVIDMIASIQKWIDQAISFEWIINPAETSPSDLYAYYMKARQQGIKTIYYVRSMSLDVKDCSSCSW
jgi:ribonucleoside-diphosphate reductase alpha chain